MRDYHFGNWRFFEVCGNKLLWLELTEISIGNYFLRFLRHFSQRQAGRTTNCFRLQQNISSQAVINVVLFDLNVRVEIWENEKSCGNTSHRRVFLQLFRVLPNFRDCFYLLNTENMFSISARNKESNLFTFIIKIYSLYSHHQCVNSSCELCVSMEF